MEEPRTSFDIVDLTAEHVGIALEILEAYYRELRRFDALLCLGENWKPYFTRILENAVQSEHYHFLLARDSGAIAGFVSYWVAEEPAREGIRSGYISDIYIKPGFRRCGYGTALVREVFRRLGESSVRSVQLSVYMENGGALEFWRAFGFSPFTYRMRRPLPAEGAEDGVAPSPA